MPRCTWRHPRAHALSAQELYLENLRAYLRQAAEGLQPQAEQGGDGNVPGGQHERSAMQAAVEGRSAAASDG